MHSGSSSEHVVASRSCTRALGNSFRVFSLVTLVDTHTNNPQDEKCCARIIDWRGIKSTIPVQIVCVWHATCTCFRQPIAPVGCCLWCNGPPGRCGLGVIPIIRYCNWCFVTWWWWRWGNFSRVRLRNFGGVCSSKGVFLEFACEAGGRSGFHAHLGDETEDYRITAPVEFYSQFALMLFQGKDIVFDGFVWCRASNGSTRRRVCTTCFGGADRAEARRRGHHEFTVHMGIVLQGQRVEESEEHGCEEWKYSGNHPRNCELWRDLCWIVGNSYAYRCDKFDIRVSFQSENSDYFLGTVVE